MSEEYIRIERICRKLKTAEAEGRTLYIGGAAGIGKTAAVRNYYSGKDCLFCSCRENRGLPADWTGKMSGQTVVIDDLSFLTSPEEKSRICAFLLRSSAHVILISRSRVPDWLKETAIRQRFLTADVWDLVFGEDEIRKLFRKRGICTDRLPLAGIREDTLGYAPEVIAAASYLEDGRAYGSDVAEMVRLDAYQYLKSTAFELWDRDMRDLAMRMSMFESFDLSMLKIVTGDRDAGLTLGRLINETDLLLAGGDGTWSIRPRVREYLKFMFDMDCTETQKKDICNRAGIYYELNGNISEALRFYDLSGNQDKVFEVLEKNAEKHPGVAKLYETKDYYLNMPEKMILKSPALISVMSMLYSVLMQPEKSEEWYEKLKTFAKEARPDSEEKREAERRLLTLDITLPHRGSTDLLHLLKLAAELLTKKNVELPELSVTSNMPSLMSGGKDFCEWSRRDRTLAATIGKPVAQVLGRFGKGLVELAVAESGIEKGTLGGYEAVTLLNRAGSQAEAGGKIEMSFVADALMARVHIANNKLSVAEMLMKDFREKAVREGAEYLLPNVDAFCLLFSLLMNRKTEISAWLSAAPDENVEFRLMERFRYLMKVRAYISENRLEEAASLLERLDYYFTRYARTYNRLETAVLKSVVLYRREDPLWKETLRGAVRDAGKYHFIPVIAREGSAVYPLLQEISADAVFQKEYGRALLGETKQAAINYPDYLQAYPAADLKLTEAEKEILNLLCRGIATREICSMLNIGYSTLKFHNRNLYRKLGVSSRMEAVKKAEKLRLTE